MDDFLNHRSLSDNEYFKIYTVFKLLHDKDYVLEKKPSHMTRDNILYQYYNEYKNLKNEELLEIYNNEVEKVMKKLK